MSGKMACSCRNPFAVLTLGVVVAYGSRAASAHAHAASVCRDRNARSRQSTDARASDPHRDSRG